MMTTADVKVIGTNDEKKMHGRKVQKQKETRKYKRHEAGI